MAILTGYALPIQGVPADHTYVISDDGFTWPCWGRSAGGTAISTGNGSSTQANCISKPWSTSGLIYGVTGVCHQTANRILFPARVLVSRARGYGLSVALYGTYGSDGLAWPVRLALCTRGIGAGGGGVFAQQEEGEPGQSEYLERVLDLYTGPVGGERFRLRAELQEPRQLLTREMDLLAEFRLGSDGRFVSGDIAELQQDALAQKELLNRSLLADEISGIQFAQELNEIAADLVRQSAERIGIDRAERLFDHLPGERTEIVELEIMAEAYPRR